MQKIHKAVLLDEIVRIAGSNKVPLQNQTIVDATLGFGGHACEFIKQGAFVIGIDTDMNSLKKAEVNMRKACPATLSEDERSCFELIHGNFKDFKNLIQRINVSEVDFILFDLGVNTVQLTSDTRGLSFSFPKADLDMRLDQSTQNVKASDLLNTLREDQLVELFCKVLNWNESKRISKKIISARNKKLFKVVSDLLEVLPEKPHSKIHPATKVFMALRMAVNSELENFSEALPQAFDLLTKGGMIAVISFHSGEDKITKQFFKSLANENKARMMFKKPIVPDQSETKDNPSARSAKLRVLIKQ